jgi:hypothetical protein
MHQESLKISTVTLCKSGNTRYVFDDFIGSYIDLDKKGSFVGGIFSADTEANQIRMKIIESGE